ncbi:MAG: MBL fold metallo-hydrolase [Oligoflexia bacterium]|nr:MBL fold metallo-hydrolase [Oligoflexia bacterium]
MQNKITILGTGTSTGVPTIGCDCHVCTSEDKYNKRLRTSVYIECANGPSLLVDTSPDLRYQVLRTNIKKIDGVIITHEHADHLHGIDDLRPFCFARSPQQSKQSKQSKQSNKIKIPIYTNQRTAEELTTRFPYIFQSHKIFDQNHPHIGGGIPHLELKLIDTTSTTILGEEFTFFLNSHGYTETISFIHHKKLAYFVDVTHINKKTLEILKNANLEILILDCLREKKHQTHLNLETALDYAEYIDANFTGLTHLAHNLEHQSLNKFLNKRYNNKSKIQPLYDGQIFYY